MQQTQSRPNNHTHHHNRHPPLPQPSPQLPPPHPPPRLPPGWHRYVSDADGDDFVEACLPANLEDDGYNLVRTQDDYGAFIMAGEGLFLVL